MSECVVRMEMPTENTVCELNYYSNGYREWRCTITDKRCDHNKNGMFPSWCPIICQLPEGHGRLVDADACEGVLRKLENEAVNPTGKLCFGYAAKMFEEAFTIVPAAAERSETCLD